MQNTSVVDLFCGIGGLTRGFLDEGFKVVAGIDFDSTCKYSYEHNNKTTFLHRDINKMSASEINNLFGSSSRKILIGCAPCQPYSIINRKNGKNIDEKDERWKLLYSFSSLICQVKPSVVSMENVPLLKGFLNGKIFDDFVSNLEKCGYSIYYAIHDAQHFGVPQRRLRLVLLASLLGPIQMIEPTHKNSPVTVKDAIGHLPKILAGEVDYSDPLHRSRSLTELSLQRIKATPEGGSWKDWDESLIADCHKRKGGKAYGSAYGRMSWNSVAPTMTTYCTGYNNGRFGHPDQDRAITLREAAILQSFPTSYDFIDPGLSFSSSRLARHIGNAVPVLLGRAIARSVANHLDRY